MTHINDGPADSDKKVFRETETNSALSIASSTVITGYPIDEGINAASYLQSPSVETYHQTRFSQSGSMNNSLDDEEKFLDRETVFINKHSPSSAEKNPSASGGTTDDQQMQFNSGSSSVSEPLVCSSDPSVETSSQSMTADPCNEQQARKKRIKIVKKGAKLDAKSKLEKSRQSARECRARKKLRYQYLEDLVCNREKAVVKLREELSVFQAYSKKIDDGTLSFADRHMLIGQTKENGKTQ